MYVLLYSLYSFEVRFDPVNSNMGLIFPMSVCHCRRILQLVMLYANLTSQCMTDATFVCGGTFDLI